MSRCVVGVDEVGRGCERPDAEVLTPHGWKFYTELCSEDQVMSLTDSNEIYWQNIDEILEFDFEGNLIELRNKALHAVVTPEHSFDVLVRKSKRFPNEGNKEKVVGHRLVRKNVEDLVVNDYIPRSGAWVGKRVDWFVLPPAERSIKDNCSINVPRYVPMTNWLRFLGLYLSEGCCIAPYKGNYRVHISQIKLKHMPKIVEILSLVPFNFKKITGGFVVCDKGLHDYLSTLGNVYSKHIPFIFKNLPSDLLGCLWEGMLIGDGCEYFPQGNRKKQITYYTSSPRLKNDVEELLIKMGYSFRTTSRYRIGVNSTIKQTCPNYAIRLKYSGKTAVKQLSKKYIPYQGKVFCLSLPNHHNFLVKRSGSAYFTGNSLAGPVVAAAVIMPDEYLPWMDEIRDSKKLSPKKREYLSALIQKHCMWSIRESSVEEVDTQNILRASLEAMRRAVASVCNQSRAVELVLVDGTHRIPRCTLPQETVKGGDDIHKCIGAASIIAKVHRDNYMVVMDTVYPEYGFSQHKGYGTEQHRQAIMVHGITPLHRKTFRGVAAYV